MSDSGEMGGTLSNISKISKSFSLPLENFHMQKGCVMDMAVKVSGNDEAGGMASCEIRH